MNLSIRGSNEKLSKPEIRSIIRFSGKLLLGKKLCENISIRVINKKLNRLEWGYCGPTDYDVFYHRNFEITLNNHAGRKTQIITLLHEMVHVKQYARAELRSLENLKFRWLGRHVKPLPHEYETLPWEIEAALSENILYRLYKEHLTEGDRYV